MCAGVASCSCQRGTVLWGGDYGEGHVRYIGAASEEQHAHAEAWLGEEAASSCMRLHAPAANRERAGPGAAEAWQKEVEQLRAENARLRKALEKLASVEVNGVARLAGADF